MAGMQAIFRRSELLLGDEAMGRIAEKLVGSVVAALGTYSDASCAGAKFRIDLNSLFSRRYRRKILAESCFRIVSVLRVISFSERGERAFELGALSCELRGYLFCFSSVFIKKCHVMPPENI